MAAKVLIVDDHVLVRQGISRLLAAVDDLEVVGEAGDGDEAIALAHELRPDLVLMDLFLPTVGGLEATRAITRDLPGVSVILLTASDEEDDIFQAIAAGARGYVVKTTDHAEMVRQIKQVASGHVSISPAIVGKLAIGVRRRGGTGPSAVLLSGEMLTDREMEVLRWIGRGARNKEIAITLSISTNTVRAHVRNILHKLAADNRAQLAAYAVRHRLV